MERELIERARRGDRAAYEQIVRRKVETVYRTARAILGNDADADDATQEALIGAWRRIGSLRDADRFDAWLGRITINACRMALRRRRTGALVSLDPGLDGPGSPSAEVADGRTSGFEARTVSADAFDRAFDRLPVEQRSILVLHHRDGLGLGEIAARLGIPEGTVKSRLSVARAALDRSLVREGLR
ncbi:MAG: sigma-70 family RNA polymerase sigma factor [Chloroflexi bacterium]|nr:sigma-70 family RNA polymerase sigma factor [Chloroflexota bacterium]